jgi:hypothetical protein
MKRFKKHKRGHNAWNKKCNASSHAHNHARHIVNTGIGRLAETLARDAVASLDQTG